MLSHQSVFKNIITYASVALFSKTNEAEQNGELMKNPIGYFTNTFKALAYNYIDNFREIHIVAKCKENKHIGLPISKKFIEE